MDIIINNIMYNNRDNAKIEFKYKNKVYDAYLHRCRRCGKINVILYSIRYFICEHCGAIEEVRIDLKRSVTDLEDVKNWRKIEEEIWRSVYEVIGENVK